MSVLTCAEVREFAPELALGILGGGERAEVILHVNGCARCQAYLAELTEAADAIPQLVPEIEPPVGFETRTLRRLDENRRRSRRRWVASIAAVAAAVAIISVTVVRVVEAGDDTPLASGPTVTTMRSPGLVAVAMKGGTAQVAAPAGWAYVANRHGVAVSVDYGVPSGNYRVQVQPTKGAPTSIGTIAIEANHGSWTGRSPQALTTGARIALVDATGREVCHGTVPVAE
jgi:Putative zinc-finger